MKEQTFDSVSYSAIPYPLPIHLRSLHNKHERGALEFPVDLIPPYSATLKCEHAMDTPLIQLDDPIWNRWISKKGIINCKEATTIENKIEQPTFVYLLARVRCRQMCDGQDGLLSIWTESILFYHGYLFQYLPAFNARGQKSTTSLPLSIYLFPFSSKPDKACLNKISSTGMECFCSTTKNHRTLLRASLALFVEIRREPS